VASPPISRIAEDADAGRNCPYCRFAFKAGVELTQCGVCSAQHHEDCWADNGGCAVLGCAGGPAATTVRDAPRPPRPAPPSPPPVTPRAPSPRPAAPPPPPAATQRATSPAAAPAPAARNRRLALVLLGLAIVAGVVVATLAASGAFSSRAPTGSTPSGPPPPAASGDEPRRPLEQDRDEIRALLGRYATAYTNHDTKELRFVFTPTVTRHGLARGGCVDGDGRSEVLAQYRQQFALGTGRYTLTGLSPDAITVDGTTAHVDARFAIGNARSGPISFDAERFRDVWRVSRVDSHC
jgi:hypothetical protein